MYLICIRFYSIYCSYSDFIHVLYIHYLEYVLLVCTCISNKYVLHTTYCYRYWLCEWCFLVEQFVVEKLCRTIKHTHSNGFYNCCLRALNFESLSWFQRLHASNSTLRRCWKPPVSSISLRFHVWYMIYVPLFTYIWLIFIVNLWVYVYKDNTWILWEKLTNKLSFQPSCGDEHQKGFWRNSKSPPKSSYQLPRV